jgi:hypothetical protein
MIIIPNSRKTTFQSIPVSSEKKASLAPTNVEGQDQRGAARAAATRSIRSEAIRI